MGYDYRSYPGNGVAIDEAGCFLSGMTGCSRPQRDAACVLHPAFRDAAPPPDTLSTHAFFMAKRRFCEMQRPGKGSVLGKIRSGRGVLFAFRASKDA